MTRVVPVVVLLSLVLASCGETATENESSEFATGESAPDGQSSAHETLRQAIDELLDEDTGRFEQVTVVFDEPIMTGTGSYDLSRSAVETMVEVDVPDREPGTLVVRRIEDESYLNSPDWSTAIRECWLTFDNEALSAMSGMSVGLAAADGQVVEPLAALQSASGESFGNDGSVIDGTIDLMSATFMLIQTSSAMEFTAAELSGTAAAQFELTDGVLTALTITGSAVVDGMAENFDVPEDVATALTASRVEVQYFDLGTPVEIEQPPADLRMTSDQMDSGSCDA